MLLCSPIDVHNLISCLSSSGYNNPLSRRDFFYELSELMSKNFSKTTPLSLTDIFEIKTFQRDFYNALITKNVSFLNNYITSPFSINDLKYNLEHCSYYSQFPFFLASFNFLFDKDNFLSFDTLSINSDELYLNTKQVSSLLAIPDISHLNFENTNVPYLLSNFSITNIIYDNSASIRFNKYLNYLEFYSLNIIFEHNDIKFLKIEDLSIGNIKSNCKFIIDDLHHNGLIEELLIESPFLFAKYSDIIEPNHINYLFDDSNKLCDIQFALGQNSAEFSLDTMKIILSHELTDTALITKCFNYILKNNFEDLYFILKKLKPKVSSNALSHSNYYLDPYFWQNTFFEDFDKISMEDIKNESSFNILNFTNQPKNSESLIVSNISSKFYSFLENENIDNIIKTFVSNPDFIYIFFLLGKNYIDINGRSFEGKITVNRDVYNIKILDKSAFDSKYYSILESIMKHQEVCIPFVSNMELQILLLSGFLDKWIEIAKKFNTLDLQKIPDIMRNNTFLRYYREVKLQGSLSFSNKLTTIHHKKKI